MRILVAGLEHLLKNAPSFRVRELEFQSADFSLEADTQHKRIIVFDPLVSEIGRITGRRNVVGVFTSNSDSLQSWVNDEILTKSVVFGNVIVPLEYFGKLDGYRVAPSLANPIDNEAMSEALFRKPRIFSLNGDGATKLELFFKILPLKFIDGGRALSESLRPGDLVIIRENLVGEQFLRSMVTLIGMGCGVITDSKLPLKLGFEENEDYYFIDNLDDVTPRIYDYLSLDFLRHPVVYRGYQKVCENFDVKKYLYSIAMHYWVEDLIDHKGGV